jgi:hypothetical protein
MDNNELTALANDLLVCYLDNAETELGKVAAKHGVKIGDKIFTMAVDRVRVMVSASDEGWGMLSPANKTKIVNKSIQTICEETGAQLGKDISMVDGGAVFNANIIQPFIDSLPPEKLAELEAKGHIKNHNQDPFKMLEASLDVPFFSSIEAIAKLRVQTLDNAKAGAYLVAMMEGIHQRHQWIDKAWISQFLRRVWGDRFDEVAAIDQYDPDDLSNICEWVFTDLLAALGKFECIKEHPEFGQLLDRDSILALDKVFRGKETSLAELAERLRRLGDSKNG